jgi:hypothetical protein
MTEHYTGEIVPAEAAEIVPVDPPEPPRPDPVQTIYGTALHARTADRRPIVPAYLRSRTDAAALAGLLAYRSGFRPHLYYRWSPTAGVAGNAAACPRPTTPPCCPPRTSSCTPGSS